MIFVLDSNVDIKVALRTHLGDSLQVGRWDTIWRIRRVSLEVNLEALGLPCLLLHSHQVEFTLKIAMTGFRHSGRLFETWCFVLTDFLILLDSREHFGISCFSTRRFLSFLLVSIDWYLNASVVNFLVLGSFACTAVAVCGLGPEIRFRWVRVFSSFLKTTLFSLPFVFLADLRFCHYALIEVNNDRCLNRFAFGILLLSKVGKLGLRSLLVPVSLDTGNDDWGTHDWLTELWLLLNRLSRAVQCEARYKCEHLLVLLLKVSA